jgi:hypothetical protein
MNILYLHILGLLLACYDFDTLSWLKFLEKMAVSAVNQPVIVFIRWIIYESIHDSEISNT